MRILVVEGDDYKRKSLECILEKENVEFIFIKAIIPALRYIHDNSNDIEGIILDLDLPRYDKYNSWKTIIHMGGLDILEEMSRLELYIPILINSYEALTVQYDEHLVDTYNIKCETSPLMPNYAESIRSFISSIEKGEF